MPPGFGVLDTALVSIPIFLTLLGLIRGAPVEFASCVGCLAGIFATWLVSCIAPVQALGQPAAPLIALAAGVAVWRLVRGVSNRYGFDTRWIDVGRVFDMFAGGFMGGLRGVALVSAGCLSYAMIGVPLGLANPMRTVIYPVFLGIGSRVTSAALQAAAPVTAQLAEATPAQNMATVPLPFIAPHIGQPEPSFASNGPARFTPPPFPSAAVPPTAATGVAMGPVTQTANGPGLASLIHAFAPDAAAAPMQPMPQPQPPPAHHPDIPVRGVPVSLIETHHNILNPLGSGHRRPPHR